MGREHRVKNFAGLMLLLVLILSGTVQAATPRKLKNKVTPEVPPIVHQMRLAGVVRIEIVVGTDGRVKSTKALGGHPLLIECAERALKKWQYERGPETTTIVEFHFTDSEN